MHTNSKSGKLFFACLVLTLLLGFTMPLAASGTIRVIIRGQPLPVTTSVRVSGGTTWIPLREFAEQTGGVVTWAEEQQEVRIRLGETEVRLRAGQPKVTVNGAGLSLSQPPQLLAGRLYIPLRAFSQIIGEPVYWDEPTQTVIVGARLNEAAGPDAALFSVFRDLYQALPGIFKLSSPAEIRQALSAYYAGDLLEQTGREIWAYVQGGATDYGVFAYAGGEVVQKNPLTATVRIGYTYTYLGAPPEEGYVTAGLEASPGGWRIIQEVYH